MISESTTSGGGPIIALSAETAHLWRGTLPPVGVEVPEDWEWGDDDDIICDYDRACDDLKDTVSFGNLSLGWLPVGEDSMALSFQVGDATFVPEATGGIIVTDFFEEEPLSDLINAISPNVWKLYPQTITLKDGRMFLFDSAFEGYKNPEDIEADGDVAVAQLSPGTYKIFYYQSDEYTGFIRLVKQ